MSERISFCMSSSALWMDWSCSLSVSKSWLSENRLSPFGSITSCRTAVPVSHRNCMKGRWRVVPRSEDFIAYRGQHARLCRL
eukprot:9047664-Ditylum_brightwellii.AAC.1